jgi:flagellin-specific chaperone FliS
MSQSIAARERLEAAKRDIAEARKTSPEELVAMALDETVKPLKEAEARAKVRQLQDESESRTRARETIDAELLRARDSLDSNIAQGSAACCRCDQV